MFARLLVILALAGLAVGLVARSSHGAGPERAYVVKPTDTLWSIAARNYAGDVREVEADVGERGQELGVEARRAVVSFPAMAGLDELVDAVRSQGRDEPGEVARVLGDRVRLVELADLGVELGGDVASIDLEHG